MIRRNVLKYLSFASAGKINFRIYNVPFPLIFLPMFVSVIPVYRTCHLSNPAELATSSPLVTGDVPAIVVPFCDRKN